MVHLRSTLLLDDLLAVTREFLRPDVSRSGLDRCLCRHGVGNLNALKPISLYTTFLRFRPSPLGACKCLIHMSRGVLPIINMTNRKPLIYMEFLSCV